MAKERIKRTAGKAVDVSRFPLKEVFRASRDLGMSLMRGVWGKSRGKNLLRSAAPWKGVTIGIEGTDAKIAAVKAVSPGVAARNKAFSTMMTGLKGTNGVVVARTASGGVEIVPRIAYEASRKGRNPMTSIQSMDNLEMAERYVYEHGLEAEMVAVTA